MIRIFALVKTSNPSSGELQDLVIDGKPLYEKVAELVSGWARIMWASMATVRSARSSARRIRSRRAAARGYAAHVLPRAGLHGARRARARTMLRSALIKRGSARLSTRRGPLCARTKEAGDEKHFAKAAKDEAVDMTKAINAAIGR